VLENLLKQDQTFTHNILLVSIEGGS